MGSEAYDKLNKEWKGTCRVLLGDEVGELDEFRGWLSTHMRANRSAKSYLSGKETALGEMPYYEKARFVSFDEIDFAKKDAPLNVNQIKDFDSLLEAVGERICYSGNIVLGNSGFAETSAHVLDSFYVYRSDEVFSSKYVAYTTHCIYSDKCFGSCGFSGSFGICANTFLSNRTFEVSRVDYSSDIYFSHGLSGCNDCMFCFNLKNRRYSIGNLALTKEKYLQLKTKLAWEIREELRRNHRLPRLEEISSASKPDYSKLKAIERKSLPPGQNDMAPMEKAYSRTCELVLGRSLGAMGKCGKWLSRDAATFCEAKSCRSGETILVPGKYAWHRIFPKDRLIKLEEADWAGEALALTESEAASLSFPEAGKSISKIAFFCPEWRVGNNHNAVDCPASMDSSNCFRCEINIGAKNCSHTFWPRDSDSIAGSFACRASAHSLKCYFSQNLQRCFEVDASRNCADCYFCHNCENVHDSMFCFNVKNLKYAIGNAEVGREEYLRLKKILVGEIAASIEKMGGHPLSIYNLGEKRR